MQVESLSQELEILQLREQLDTAKKSLQDFVYAVSHDLGAPLRAVTGFSAILQNKYTETLDDTARSYLAFVSEGGGKAQQMLNGLLQYSRIYSQATPQAFTDLQSVLERAIATMRDRVAASEAEIICKELPEAFVDANQVETIFRIIIDNALTYRHPMIAPRIEITTQESDSHWRILVSDNGIGIAKENAERVFQVFKRLHADESYPGIGMGLPVARRIVERHGGEMGVLPQRTRGTTTWFTLPKMAEDCSSESMNWRELSHG